MLQRLNRLAAALQRFLVMLVQRSRFVRDQHIDYLALATLVPIEMLDF